MSDPRQRAACPVCNTFNREVELNVGGPDRWLDCGHTSDDLMARITGKTNLDVALEVVVRNLSA